MKVLFVDDEPRVLEGLERALFDIGDDIEFASAPGGAEALARLASEEFEVIVTDMRMPGVDGAELLEWVHVTHPGLVRIVLSGQTDEAQAMRAAPFAHRFLAKPCDPSALVAAIRSTFRLRDAIKDDVVRRAIGSLDKLPTTPLLYAALRTALMDPDVDAGVVSDVVRRDPAMVMKVLQLANSSLFSRGRPLSDIRAAVVRLGSRAICHLVLAVEAFTVLGGGQAIKGFSVEQEQRHATQSAAIARLLAPRVADEAIVGAMLCDIGRHVLALTAPDRVEQAFEHAAEKGIAIELAEYELFGVTHAEVGGYLVGLWGLPLGIVEAIAYHHQPERIPPSPEGDAAAAVCVAHALAAGVSPDPSLVERFGGMARLAEAVGSPISM
jgi:HD-like signal output (HDOD) protein/CheY-like chemotaxis protein